MGYLVSRAVRAICSSCLCLLALSLNAGSAPARDGEIGGGFGLPLERGTSGFSASIPSTIAECELLKVDARALKNDARTGGVLRVEVDGNVYDLILTPNVLWRSGPRAMVHDESGLHEADVPVPDVYKGKVLQDPAGRVRLTFGDDWVSGYVYADGAWHFIEPLRWHDAGVDGSIHILYDSKDVVSEVERMGAVLPGAESPETLGGEAGREGAAANKGPALAEEQADLRVETGDPATTYGTRDGLAAGPAGVESLDAPDAESQLLTADIIPYGDVEFYNMSPGDWFARMTAVVNDVEGIFADAIGVEFNIVLGIVWRPSTPGYPLTSTSSSTLLSQLRTYSLENYSHSRHFIHLLTGKNLDDNGLQNGYSYPNSIGWCYGYSLAQQAAEGVYGATVFEKAIVSANALGRAFNARGADAISNAWCWCGGNPGFICRTIMWDATTPEWICRITQFSDENIARMESVDDVVLGDVVPPDCQAIINGGAPYTRSAEVSLEGSCTDTGSGMDVYRFGAEGGAWDDWACGTPGTVGRVLTGGDGPKALYLQCRDKAGNQSECADTIILDRAAPSCAVSIEGGAPYAGSTSVTLSLSCSDATSGLSRMRFKNSTGSWGEWEPYAATKAWILPSGDGVKTVYLEVEDGAGNTSQCSDEITLDATPPTCSIVIDGGETYALSAGVNLELSSSDAGSGLAGMRFKDEGGSWTSWQAYSVSKSWTLPGSDGLKTVYVEFKDNAGNTRLCADAITLDTSPPVCSIAINGGDDYTGSADVILNLNATDAGSGVTEMRLIDEGTPWTAWEPYAATRQWTLPSMDGQRVVFVEFRDALGHTSHCSDKIILDLTGPTCSIQIEGGAPYSTDHEVALSLAATDALGEVAEMRFIDESTPWTAWEPFATSKSWSLPAGEGSKAVFVEFKDSAGNTANCSDDIVVDTIAPGCSLAINGGAAQTAYAAVTLDVSATDSGSGLSEMRFKNDSDTWTPWEPYSDIKSWSLPGDDGTKTVYVAVRDNAGNETQCSDDIELVRDVTCSILINSGDEYTALPEVILDLSSFSASGVEEMRFQNEGSGWSEWEPYAEEKSWSLSAGDGGKTVYVEFEDALQNTSECSDAILLDTASPTCSIVISGDSTYVAGHEVTLGLAASDAGIGVTDMRFKDDFRDWTEWEPFADTKPWTLSVGEGSKTVYAEFRDGLGFASQCSDDVIVDTTAPACSLAVEGGDAYTDSAEVTLAVFSSDSGSGVFEMRFRDEGGAWSPWEAYADSIEWTLLGGDGSKTVHAELRDVAGNVSTCSDDIFLDGTPPTCSIDINGGEEYAMSPDVSLELSSMDAGAGVVGMRFKDDGGTWTEWEAYAASRLWALPGGDGSKTVYVEFRDAAGNSSVCSDTIILETAAPSCSILIDGGAAYAVRQSVMLDLVATDAGSGLGGMRLSNDGSSWGEWEPYAETRSWTLPAGDGEATVYVEFRDNAGNSSVCSDTIVLDTKAPSCSVVIDGDGPYATLRDVTLSLASGDAGTGVAEMGFSDDALAWTNWEPYAETRAWTLLGPDGTKTVYARFRDAAGNVSECSDAIMLDTTPPTCSVLINEGVPYAVSTNAILNLSAIDAGSGLSEMRFKEGSASWTAWEPFAATKSWILESGDTEKLVSAQFKDMAGNFSECSDGIVLDTVPPSCSIEINGDSTYAVSPVVRLTLSSSDAGSGVGYMRFANEGGSWGEWEENSASADWTLSEGDGDKTVYAEFRDNAGLSTQCSDAVILDTGVPSPVTGLEACGLSTYEITLCWEWYGEDARGGSEAPCSGPSRADLEGPRYPAPREERSLTDETDVFRHEHPLAARPDHAAQKTPSGAGSQQGHDRQIPRARTVSPVYFDIRHSLTSLDSLTWLSTPSDTLLPAAVGQGSFLVTGLLPDTLYYVGVRVMDEAGNASAIVTVSARTPFDTTPPTLAMGIWQDPVLTSRFDVYVTSSEPLDEGSLLVTAGSDTIAMERLDGEDEVYGGIHQLAGSGLYEVCAQARDLVGLNAETCGSFSARYVRAATGGTARSPDGILNALFDPDDLMEDSYILISADSILLGEAWGSAEVASGGQSSAEDEPYGRVASKTRGRNTGAADEGAHRGSYDYGVTEGADDVKSGCVGALKGIDGDSGPVSQAAVVSGQSDREALTPAYTISPPELGPAGPVELRFKLSPSMADVAKIAGVFRWQGEQWSEARSHWDELDGVLVAFVDSFGDYQVQSPSSNSGPNGGVIGPLLSGPYPNPFMSETRLIINLPAEAPVEVSVYDARGRFIRRLMDAHGLAARSYVVTWDGLTREKTKAPSGVYLFRVDLGKEIKSRRVVYAR